MKRDDIRDVSCERLLKDVFKRLGNSSAKVTQWFGPDDYEHLVRESYRLARELGWPRPSIFAVIGYYCSLPSYAKRMSRMAEKKQLKEREAQLEKALGMRPLKLKRLKRAA